MPEKPFDPHKHSVNELEQKLYDKQTKIKAYERRRFHAQDRDTATTWQPDVVAQAKTEVAAKEPMTLFTKILIVAGIFFVFSLAAAFAVFYFGQNQVSYDNVELSILGPNSVSGGEALVFDVNVVNNNDVALEIADIKVTYPRGTVSFLDGGTRNYRL